MGAGSPLPPGESPFAIQRKDNRANRDSPWRQGTAGSHSRAEKSFDTKKTLVAGGDQGRCIRQRTGAEPLPARRQMADTGRFVSPGSRVILPPAPSHPSVLQDSGRLRGVVYGYSCASATASHRLPIPCLSRIIALLHSTSMSSERQESHERESYKRLRRKKDASPLLTNLS